VNTFDWAMALIVLAVICFSVAGQMASYRNGVTDGYGYAREPNSPGYQAAGKYLRETMRHRWPELTWPRGAVVGPHRRRTPVEEEENP
jgi:hypothetical protein